jgi:isopentenyl-diphosphate delta-isomerase
MIQENIYFVDEKDNPTGEVEEKLQAHNSQTKLHAAFSSYVFNKEGKFLVTQRAHTKKVWHGVWTNSCCGHPMPGESREEAVKRRLQFELGLEVENITLVIPDYIYKTPPYSGIIENEYCPIYVCITDNDPKLNPDEVEEYKWVDWDWYVEQLNNDSNDYSMFAEAIPNDSDLGTSNIPKWSWWSKDQLPYLQKSKIFKDFIKTIDK